MRNDWICLEETSFAQWEASFGSPATLEDVETLFQYGAKVLKTAERTDVFKQNAVSNFVHPDAAANMDLWVRFWRSSWEKMGVLPFFDLRVDENWLWINGSAGRICYFDRQGQRQESVVSNAGQLLKTLLDTKEDHKGFTADIGPISLLSTSIRKKDLEDPGSQHSKPFVVRISLGTDIWFPRVLGLIHYEQPLLSPVPDWHDNRELALCHTPRLNRFLKEAHRLTLEAGGNWTLVPPEGIAKHYADMVGEDSVVLDN
jgi:hypothetical protein